MRGGLSRVTPIGAAGVVMLLLAVLLPVGWYAQLPRDPSLPPAPALNGVLLLKLALGVQGAVLLGLGLRGWRYRRIAGKDLLPSRVAAAAGDLAPRHAAWLLAAITIVGAVLRAYRLGSDLWLDEITPILNYGGMSPLEVLATYSRTNNHLLNTLLVKLTTGLFEESEWAIRLPAVLFGIATIPLLYWLARFALSRWASLSAALLLAASYHHVFFSQNARGYSSYLFFSLLATGLLLQGLREDRPRVWAGYAAATALNFAAILLSAFVFAAHVLIGCGALYAIRRRGGSVAPLARRLAGVFGLCGMLGLSIYALVLPDIYVVIQNTYSTPFAGFSPFTWEFLREIERGIGAGFGTGVLFGAVPFVALAAAGFLSLLRRDWVIPGALFLALALGAGLLIARHLTFSPRFFILALPLAILTAVHGIHAAAEWVASRSGVSDGAKAPRAAFVVALLVAATSVASLRTYFAVPKQPYTSSLRYVEAERQPDGVVVVLHLAEKGYRYYGRRFRIDEGKDYYFVRSKEKLEEVLAARGQERVYLVSTFPRALRMMYPELDARMRADWTLARAFSATVGDGGIQVWRPRSQN